MAEGREEGLERKRGIRKMGKGREEGLERG